MMVVWSGMGLFNDSLVKSLIKAISYKASSMADHSSYTTTECNEYGASWVKNKVYDRYLLLDSGVQ